MRQETFAILFLMRKGRPKKNGLAPIFARITTGGLRQEVYTQCDSNPETWNQHKERAMGTNKLAIQVNERLNDFRVKIIDIRSKLLAEGYAANAAQIKPGSYTHLQHSGLWLGCRSHPKAFSGCSVCN